MRVPKDDSPLTTTGWSTLKKNAAQQGRVIVFSDESGLTFRTPPAANAVGRPWMTVLPH
jgi:hypothetical protein